MRNKISTALLPAFSFLLMLLLFTSCAGVLPNIGAEGSEYFNLDGSPKLSNPDFQRTPPPFLTAASSGTDIKQYSNGESNGSIDLSNLSQGYVSANVVAQTTAVFWMQRGEDEPLYYSLKNNGESEVYPLSFGEGHYTFIIYLNVGGTSYTPLMQEEADVTLESEQAPFLVPNQVVNYTQNSKAVQKAYELAQNCSTDAEVAAQIYYWIKENIAYDTDKADAASSGELNSLGYVPNVDETLESGLGICYDYAALAAAMLRANGIPCKLIKGYVSVTNAGAQQEIYHAWNLVWLEDIGWVAIKLPSKPDDWQQIDTTFAASNSDDLDKYIGSGERYLQTSVH
ncbi:MAG: transglutaminase-like domain-containing protein [Oscillospiraceae bacterium]